MSSRSEPLMVPAARSVRWFIGWTSSSGRGLPRPGRVPARSGHFCFVWWAKICPGLGW
jgi:hypothetical protein